MNDRKAELERKKERLRQIREEKERRRREREQADAKVGFKKNQIKFVGNTMLLSFKKM